MKQKFKYSSLVLFILIFISAILGLLRFNSFQVGTYEDDAHYVVLAESLASGQGYRLINFPNEPAERNFPPGWPLLLTPLTALVPGNYTVLKLLPFIYWLASTPLIYKLFALRIKTPYLEMLMALITLNPGLVGHSGMLMAETAYLFFTLLTLNIFEYWNSNRHKAIEWLLVAVAIAALYTQLIRTVGISILLAIILYLLFKRCIRQLGIVIGVVALGVLPQIWLNSQNGGTLISSGYEYQVLNSSPTTKLAQVWENLQSYSEETISNSLISVFGPNVSASLGNFGLGVIPSIINIGILLTVISGLVLSFRNFSLGDLYIGFYFLGILSFWNPEFYDNTTPRFLIPIIPFLYFYMMQGTLWFVRRITHQNNKHVLVIMSTLLFLIISISLGRNIQDWRNPIRNRITDLSIGTTWVRENTPPESVVLARDPVPAYLYARRKTVAYPTQDQDIKEFIQDNSIDYIIISSKLQTTGTNELDDFTQATLLPFITSRPNDFQLAYKNSIHNVSVYKFHSDK